MRGKNAERIRRDLEQRGVAPDFSRSVSDRLEPFTEELSIDAYEAILSGVAMAYGVHRRGPGPPAVADFDSMQRLMSDFADELHKLDEALEMLAAYVVRLRTEARPTDRMLH